MARARGELTDEQVRRLAEVTARRAKAEAAFSEVDAAYRATVLAIMAEGASFSEVSKATGLSTNTLQRWKRESS